MNSWVKQIICSHVISFIFEVQFYVHIFMVYLVSCPTSESLVSSLRCMFWILAKKKIKKKNLHLGSILNSLHSVKDASGSQYSVCVISQCFLSQQLLFPVCLCSSFSLHLFLCTFPQTAVSMETKSKRPAWVWWSAVRQRGGGRIVCVCLCVAQRDPEDCAL